MSKILTNLTTVYLVDETETSYIIIVNISLQFKESSDNVVDYITDSIQKNGLDYIQSAYLKRMLRPIRTIAYKSIMLDNYEKDSVIYNYTLDNDLEIATIVPKTGLKFGGY